MDKKLLALRGIPGCGKSTYAAELVAKGWKRVNKDDFRAMVDNSKWSKGNEERIRELETMSVNYFLAAGFNVVVDDTNFGYEDFWESVAKLNNAEYEIKTFDVPPHLCVKRDALRGDKSVGADVIYKMYRKYVQPTIVKPPYDKDLPDCYIVDIDGTLAHMVKRSPYAWDRVGEDILDEPTANIIDALAEKNKIIVVSGRDGCCKVDTEDWLDDNDIPYSHLYMRAAGDRRPDTEVKKEIYESHIKGKYNVLGVFDDRNSVVEMWRSIGLKCFQVEEGNF